MARGEPVPAAKRGARTSLQPIPGRQPSTGSALGAHFITRSSRTDFVWSLYRLNSLTWLNRFVIKLKCLCASPKVYGSSFCFSHTWYVAKGSNHFLSQDIFIGGSEPFVGSGFPFEHLMKDGPPSQTVCTAVQMCAHTGSQTQLC